MNFSYEYTLRFGFGDKKAKGTTNKQTNMMPVFERNFVHKSLCVQAFKNEDFGYWCSRVPGNATRQNIKSARLMCPKLFFCKQLSLARPKNYESSHKNIFGLSVVLDLKVRIMLFSTFNS